MARFSALLACLLLVALAALPWSSARAVDVATLVYLNGAPTLVHFNDGDSFRVVDGPYFKGKARLMGFNTLESYGPAHSFGEWHPYELFVMAKKGTLNARRGVWHCTYEGERDGYARMLVNCLDLAVDQIEKGFAHALNVDDTPARPELLRAQQQAIAARRGIWKKGVPAFVLTSLHSAAEDPTRDSHYNRLVSTRDGHTERWIHTDTYRECEQICNVEERIDEARVRNVARELRSDPKLARLLASHSIGPEHEPISNVLLIEMVARYARLGELPEYTPPQLVAPLTDALRPRKEAGDLGPVEPVLGACMVYVDFDRRYGDERAECMRGHGAYER